ncbi:hypothetical protein JL722_11453 [Aureococcus anophagefferens]|nr:hypothetical protein JL722_11453 [Aureococcus anophagefferens]
MPASLHKPQPRARRDKTEDVISRACAVVATFASRKPWRTVGLCLFLSAVLASGFSQIKNEARPDKLYVPAYMKSQEDRAWIDDRFGSADVVSSVLLDHRGDANLLTKAALRDAFDVYEDVLAISAEDGATGYDARSCAVGGWSGLCQKSSILAFWNYSRAALEDDPDVLATVNRPAPDCCSPVGRDASLFRVAAKLRYDDAGAVTYAGSLKFDFYLDNDAHEKTNVDPHAQRLERKFNEKLRRASYESFDRPMPLNAAGAAENVDGAFDYDRTFVNLASIVIFCYAYWALYDRRDPFKSRGWLGVAAAVVVLVAVLAAFGLALYCGAIFSATASIAVFLVLGIGLDDAFVICGAELVHFGDFHDDVDRIAEGSATVDDVAARRVERAMAAAGPSITVTSVTDFCAFVAGSFTAIPAISSFCAFCAAAVAVDFLLQVSLFVAIFSLDLRRKLRRAVAERASGDRARCCERCCVKEPPPTASPAGELLGGSYADALLSKPGKAFVLLATVGLAGLGASGAALTEANYQYDWFLVRGWYLTNYDYNMEHYGDSGVTWVGLYTEHADYYENRQTMADLFEAYGNLRFVASTSLESNWFSAHEAWAAGEASTFSDGTSYCYSVRDFLATSDGADYAENVVLDVSDDACEITATRVDTLWNEDEDDQSTIIRNRRMVKARQTARTYGRPLGPPKVWNFAFIFGEGVRLVSETLFSMVIACVTVAVILVFLLGDVRAAAMVSSMVVMVCVITYGSIYWCGGLNNVSAFFVVIAVGLATDASAHYCHAFQGSEKAARTTARATRSASSGRPSSRAASAVLGISMCGFCKTYVFRTFFNYLITILLLALWFGLATMPGDVADAAVVEDADAPLALAG